MIADPEIELEKYLDPGERLLWSGQPRQGLLLRPQDALLIPFSLMWGGFAIFWEVSVLSSKAPGFFALWGIPFVLMGLYLIFGRFWMDMLQRAGTLYGLTDSRAIIRSGVFSECVTSLDLSSMAEVRLVERSNGSGTISFGPTSPWNPWGGSSSWPGMNQNCSPSFDTIQDVRAVFGKVRSAQDAAKRRRTSASEVSTS